MARIPESTACGGRGLTVSGDPTVHRASSGLSKDCWNSYEMWAFTVCIPKGYLDLELMKKFKSSRQGSEQKNNQMSTLLGLGHWEYADFHAGQSHHAKPLNHTTKMPALENCIQTCTDAPKCSGYADAHEWTNVQINSNSLSTYYMSGTVLLILWG